MATISITRQIVLVTTIQHRFNCNTDSISQRRAGALRARIMVEMFTLSQNNSEYLSSGHILSKQTFSSVNTKSTKTPEKERKASMERISNID